LEGLLARDRFIVLAALVLVVVLAWSYTVSGAGMGMSAVEMSGLPWPQAGGPAMPMGDAGAMPAGTFDPARFAVLLSMWWIMMVAMMLPSAAPVILLAAALNRRSMTMRPPYGPTSIFAAGYLLAWAGFSLIAVIAQGLLEHFRVLSSMLAVNGDYLTAGLLIAAGAWQFTPIKQACLRHCRSPVHFLTRHRRPGNAGALVMGLHHGAYCLGCCWFLMMLLFVGGIMNLLWIGGIALFVLLEKWIGHGVAFGRLTGAALVACGVAIVVF